MSPLFYQMLLSLKINQRLNKQHQNKLNALEAVFDKKLHWKQFFSNFKLEGSPKSLVKKMRWIRIEAKDLAWGACASKKLFIKTKKNNARRWINKLV